MYNLLSLNILEFTRMLAQSYGGYGVDSTYVVPAPSFNIFSVLFPLAGLLVFGFVIWMLIDCATRPVKNKTMWIILMVVGGFFSGGLLSLIAAVIYALTDRNKLAVLPSQNASITQPADAVGANDSATSVTATDEQQSQLPSVITPQQPQYIKHTTTFGKVIGIIAAFIGALSLAFVIFIVVALIQCARDPKCM